MFVFVFVIKKRLFLIICIMMEKRNYETKHECEILLYIYAMMTMLFGLYQEHCLLNLLGDEFL
jgi:hypothetical protein